MKRTVCLVVLVLIASCSSKKNRSESISIGETNKMNVVTYDKTFKGLWMGASEVNERRHVFNINGDGIIILN